MAFKIKAKQRIVANMLGEGFHAVILKSFNELNTPAKDGAWADETLQYEAVFQEVDGDRTIKTWYNTKGFMKFDDLSAKEQASGKFAKVSSINGNENYAIDKKTKCRIEDPTRTGAAMDILGDLAYTLSNTEEEIDIDDFIGNTEIGICIGKNDRDKLEVKFVCSLERLEQLQEQEA